MPNLYFGVVGDGIAGGKERKMALGVAGDCLGFASRKALLTRRVVGVERL
jgi:hypothetical protein